MDGDGPGSSLSLARLFDALQRSQVWISNHAMSRLGPGVSPFDFTESLHKRLNGRVSDHSSDDEVDEVLKTQFRYLVKEQHRMELRRVKPLVSQAETSEIPDPHSLSWAEGVQRENHSRDALGLLEALPQAKLDLLREVYGFVGEEESRTELASRLGLKRNTLNKRLSRILRDLRLEASRSGYNSR